MQPLQYDLRDPAAKDITHAAKASKQPWRSHSNAICGDWVAKHNRTTRNGVGNCSSKNPDLDAQSEKKTILKHFFKRIFWRKITSTKMEKICWQITPAAEVDHRGSGTDFVWKNIGVSCICYLSKTHFVRDLLQNSIGTSSTSTTCNPIYNAGTILQLQITMEFGRPHMHEKQLKPHFPKPQFSIKFSRLKI